MMRLIPRLFAALPATLAACLLAACGGGGGDDATALSYDTDVVRVTAFNGQMADSNAFRDASVQLNVSAAQLPAGVTYIAVQDSASGFGSGRPIEVLQLSASSFRVTLYPQVTLSPGVHTGNLSVLLCKDPGCASRWPVSNATLPYEVTITPQLRAQTVVNGESIYTLTSDRGSNQIGVETTASEAIVEFTTSMATSVHYSSGPGMLQVEIDPSSTPTYWKLRVTPPVVNGGGTLGLQLWPEDSSKFIQFGTTLDVTLMPPAD